VDGTPNFIRELCRNFGHTVIFARVLGALLQNVLLSFASGHKVAVHPTSLQLTIFAILISFDGFSPLSFSTEPS
jgi:hypothetical protein